MARRTIAYIDYDDQGQTTFHSIGHVDSGSFDNDGGVDWEISMGGVATEDNQVVAPSGSVTFRPTDAVLMALCLRTTWTGTLAPLHIRVGTGSEAYEHQYAYCSRLRVEGRVGQRISATMDWIAITPDYIAVPTWTAPHTGNPLHWHQGVCTVNDAALTMQDFSLEINNNLRVHTSLDSKSAASQRIADEITAHMESVTFSCTAHLPPATGYVSNWGDAPANQAASIVFTSATPTTVTIALANLRLKNWKQGLVRSDDVVPWTLDYVGKPNTANTVSIS